MPSNIDLALFDESGPISKERMKTDFAAPAKAEIEALQEAADPAEGQEADWRGLGIETLIAATVALATTTPVAGAAVTISYDGTSVGVPEITDVQEALDELFAAAPVAPTGEITDELTDVITTARDLVAADLAIGGSEAGEVKRLLVNLGTAGRFDVAKTLPKGSRLILVIEDDSELVTIGTEDDEEGASVNGVGTVTVQSGTQVELTVVSNAGSVPVVKAEGTIIGETREIPGGLTGDVAWGDTETASFSFALADYNRLKKANNADTPIVGTIEQMSSVAGRSGNVVALRRVGAAAVSLAAGTGVTLAAITGHTLFARAVGSTIGAVRDDDALDTWWPVGDFAETE